MPPEIACIYLESFFFFFLHYSLPRERGFVKSLFYPNFYIYKSDLVNNNFGLQKLKKTFSMNFRKIVFHINFFVSKRLLKVFQLTRQVSLLISSKFKRINSYSLYLSDGEVIELVKKCRIFSTSFSQEPIFRRMPLFRSVLHLATNLFADIFADISTKRFRTRQGL